MQYPPDGWTREQQTAFDALISAIELYELYASALNRLNVTNATNPVLIQRRNELGQHIKTVLMPAFENA